MQEFRTMLITDMDGCWEVETPDGALLMIAEFHPDDRVYLEAGDEDGYYAVRNGQVVPCSPEDAEYVMGRERQPPNGPAVDSYALAEEAIRRIVAGESIKTMEE